MNRRILLAACMVIAVLILGVVSLLFIDRTPANTFTGGSGQAEVGRLSLTGYEVTSNDSSEIPLGKFLTADQQIIIRSSLEDLLFEDDPKKEYKGTITPGSFSVDYPASTLQFNVRVEEPSITYLVRFNTVDNNVVVLDETGQGINAPAE